MCHKLENPEGVEETANSQTDWVNFLDTDKQLEVLEIILVDQVYFLVVFQYNFNVLCNNNHKHCAQVKQLEKVCYSTDS
jgi:hypothetical protein